MPRGGKVAEKSKQKSKGNPKKVAKKSSEDPEQSRKVRKQAPLYLRGLSEASSAGCEFASHPPEAYFAML